jgi:hypothetical protein
MKQRFLIVVAMLVLAVAVVPAAFGGSPSNSQYPTPAGLVANAKHTKTHKTSGPKATPLPTVKSSGTLPFTGANLALVAGLGAALAAAGFGLRAVGRRHSGE